MKRERYIFGYVSIGWNTPQVQLQISPFKWGFGGGIGNRRVSLFLGPIAVVVWFRISKAVKDLEYLKLPNTT